MTPEELGKRLAAKLVRQPNGCLEWTGCTENDQGYGVVGIGGRGNQKRTHVVAWELANGRPVPKGMCVCHRCDNPPCCDATHLFLGTRAENLADMRLKDRAAIGERHGMAKLTADQVREIRGHLASGLGQSVIGRMYGVSNKTVHKIAHNQRWKALT